MIQGGIHVVVIAAFGGSRGCGDLNRCGDEQMRITLLLFFDAQFLSTLYKSLYIFSVEKAIGQKNPLRFIDFLRPCLLLDSVTVSWRKRMTSEANCCLATHVLNTSQAVDKYGLEVE